MKHAATLVILVTVAGTLVTTLGCVGRCGQAAVPAIGAWHHQMEATASVGVTDADDLMGQMQRAGATRGLNDPATHCDRMVKLARAASTQATANAELHRQLANIG